MAMLNNQMVVYTANKTQETTNKIMADGPWMACQLSSRPSYPQTGPQTVHWFRNNSLIFET